MPFVNVYLVDREYGGSEEGGWWFTSEDPVKSIPTTSMRGARRALSLAERVINRWNEGRPDIGSVLSRGRYDARIEREPARAYLQTRPHYE